MARPGRIVFGCPGAWNDDCLLVQCGHDGVDQADTNARGVSDRGRGELASSGLAQTGWATVAGEQFERGFGIQLRAESTFERWVDVGDQASDAVDQPGRFLGQVVVVADEDFQLGQPFVGHVHPAKGLRKRAGSVGDDEGVARVGLGFTRVKVRDPSHSQAR